MFPLTSNFRANSFFKAFLLNSIIGAIICAFAIELRISLNDDTSAYYGFWSNIYREKKLSELHKLLVSMFITLIVSLITYHVFYFLFMYGGGQLTNSNISSNNISLQSLFKKRI